MYEIATGAVTRSPRSLECLERAVAMDEKYALAWAGLTDTTNMLAWYRFVRPQANSPCDRSSDTCGFLGVAYSLYFHARFEESIAIGVAAPNVPTTQSLSLRDGF